MAALSSNAHSCWPDDSEVLMLLRGSQLFHCAAPDARGPGCATRHQRCSLSVQHSLTTHSAFLLLHQLLALRTPLGSAVAILVRGHPSRAPTSDVQCGVPGSCMPWSSSSLLHQSSACQVASHPSCPQKRFFFPSVFSGYASSEALLSDWLAMFHSPAKAALNTSE
jgi:hypothetical protein